MPLFPFLLLISSILTANNDYVTNGDITLCESQTDPSEDNCKGHSTEDYACCFGKYTGGSQCFKIQRNYRFALDSLSTFINENGNSVDRFKNRVMFPIIDLRGNVIAFGGRIMTDLKPKYLNTS